MRQYFDKIKDAEDPAKRPYLRSLTTHSVSQFINILDDDHHTGQLAIDKVAASRFIKHAIAQAKDTRPITVSSPTTHIRSNDNDNDNDGSGAATAHDVRVPVKVTEKMAEREKYHEALREEAQASDDGRDLEVFDGEDEPSDEARRTPPEEDAPSYSPLQASSSELDAAGKQKGKGKGKAVASSTPIHAIPPPSETASGKRRRPPVDPFAGLCHFFVAFKFCYLTQLPFFAQAMVMVRILQRPLTLAQRQIPHGQTRRFEEFIRRASVLRPRAAPIRLLAESTRSRRKDPRNDPRKKPPRE